MSKEPREETNYHSYESNPVPVWIAILWAAYFVFSIGYLLVNMLG